MANKKITELDAITTLASTDVVPVVDVSADTTNKITTTNLFRTLPDGTAAAPALAFSSDQANGVYLAGTDTVGISTGGTQRVTVDGSGNVTISGDLTVSGATTTVESTTVTIDDKNIELGSVASPSNTTADGGGITLKGATDKTLKWINSTGCWTFNQPMNFNDHVRIDSSGNVGVGTASPTSISGYKVLTLNGASQGGAVYFQQNGTNYGRLIQAGSNVTLESTQNISLIFGTNSAERMRITSSGNVGIGTSSPSQKLEVSGGGVKVSGGYFFGSTASYLYESANNQVSLRIGSDGPYLEFIDVGSNTAELGNASGELALTAGGAEKVRIKNNGSVGVGTSSPDARFEVVNSSTSEVEVARFRTEGNTNNPMLRVMVDESTGEAAIRSSGSVTGNLILGSGNNDHLTIATNGKVGIGTSSPSQELDVNGSIKASGNASIGATTGTAFIELGAGATENRTAFMDFVGDTTYSDYGLRVQRGVGGANTPSSIFHRGTGDFRLVAQEAAPIEFWTTNTERLRIDSSGDVAIGNTSADGRLHVRKDGTGEILQIWQSDLGTNNRNIQLKSPSSDSASEPFTFATANSFAFQIDNSEAFRINAAGQVGIGTTSPSAVLQTQGSRDYTGTTPGLSSYDNNFRSGTAVLSIGQSNGIPSIQGHGSGTAFNLALAPNAGKVGIGTTSPTHKLTVFDSTADVIANLESGDSIARIQLKDSAGTNYISSVGANLDFATNGVTAKMRIDSSGDVGIGESSPQDRLHIKDNASSTSLRVTTDRNGATYGNSCIVFDTPRSNSSDGAHHDGRGMISCLGSSTSTSGIVWLSAGSASLDPDETDTQLKANQSGLRLESDGSLEHWASDNARFVVSSDGKVGINGITDPKAVLDVGRLGSDWTGSDPIAGTALFVHNGNNVTGSPAAIQISGGSTSQSAIYFGDEGDSDVGSIQYFHSSNALVFRASNAERMRLSSGGNLGIGTSSPATTLELKSDANAQTTATIPTLRITNDDGSAVADDITGSVEFFSEDTSDPDHVSGFMRAISETSAGVNYALTFGTKNSSIGDAAERFRITSTGAWAIEGASNYGTSGQVLVSNGNDAPSWQNPTAGTQILQGNTNVECVDTGSNGHILFDTEGAERMRIDSSGNVGIGVATVDSPLHVYKQSSDRTARFQRISTQYIDIIQTSGVNEFESTGKSFAIGTSDSNPIILRTNDSERARIDSSGRLLVGTSSNRNNYPIQLEKAGETTFSLTRNSNDTSGPQLYLAKTRGTSVGAVTVVQNGDKFGQIAFVGANGGGENTGATISAECDGTPGTNDMPGRILFSTTADGASSPTERLRISSGGEVCIGGSSTDGQLEVRGSKGIISRSSTTQNTDTNKALIVRNNSGTNTFHVSYRGLGYFANAVRFNQNSTSVPGSGNTTLGAAIEDNGANGATLFTSRSGNFSACFNRAEDGTVVQFNSAGNAEGDVSISGSTTSYNGAHLSRWSQLAGNAERIEILRGSVLSNLDEMCEWAHAAQDEVLWTAEDELPEGTSIGDVKTPARDAYTELNEQLNRMKVSDVEGDRNVAGVFQSWDDDDDTFVNDFYCAVTGDFVIRIAQGTTVERGDLLMSAGDGTAKPQDDDIVRSKTVAKVTSTTVSTTYADGSYCVPCVLMAC